MTIMRWGFEGQSNGNNVTLGNSGTNGDPALAIASVTGTTAPPTCTYSNAHPVIGTMGMAITAGASDTVTLRTSSFTATDKLAFQTHIYLTAYPTSATAIAQWRNATTPQCHLQLDTTGKLYVLDNLTATKLLATSVLPLNTPILIDSWVQIGTTNANSSFKWRAIKVSDGTTIDSASATNLNLNNAAASPALLTCGQHGKPTSGGAIAGVYYDNLAWNDGAADYMAAPSSALGVTATFAPSTGPTPLAGTLTMVPSGGTGTTITYVIDWGDGSSNTTTTSTSAAHTYTSPGTYTGTVTASNA